MCVVSYVGDYWGRKMPEQHPWVPPLIPENPVPSWPASIPPGVTTKEDIEALRKEIEELKKLLLAAKQFDAATNQPNCEMDAKVDLIKKVAKLVGVNMDEVFKS